MVCIEASGVSKNYVRAHFFRKIVSRGVIGLDLVVKQGESYGLLGLNGSGKTTTMKLLVGLLFPDAGNIRVLGRDVQEPGIKKRIGYLPELPYLPLMFTAEELLEYYGRLCSIPSRSLKDRIRGVMKKVGLSPGSPKRLSEYSKGMLQRTALAQALLNDPECVFLDEPMSGLDPRGYKEMRDILLGLRKEGRTLLFNSHLLSEVEKLCDRVGIIVEGRLVVQRRVRDVFRHSRSLEDFFMKTVNENKKEGADA